VSDLEVYSRSSELPLFDRPYFTSLVVLSNHDCFLRCFQDFITFTVYVLDCDLVKSFIFKKTDEITSHRRFVIYLQTYRN